jgi:hypothetical protein
VVRGPEEAILYVDLKDQAHIDVEKLKETLRGKFAKELPSGTRFSFEPADIVNDVMSFGSPTPVDVSVSGPNFAESRQYAEKVRQQLAGLPYLRDLQFGQSLDYPTIEVNVDREKGGPRRPHARRCLQVARHGHFQQSLSRCPNYWADPKTGIAVPGSKSRFRGRSSQCRWCADDPLGGRYRQNSAEAKWPVAGADPRCGRDPSRHNARPV